MTTRDAAMTTDLLRRALSRVSMTDHLVPGPAWVTIVYGAETQVNQQPLVASPSATPTIYMGARQVTGKTTDWRPRWDNVRCN